MTAPLIPHVVSFVVRSTIETRIDTAQRLTVDLCMRGLSFKTPNPLTVAPLAVARALDDLAAGRLERSL